MAFASEVEVISEIAYDVALCVSHTHQTSVQIQLDHPVRTCTDSKFYRDDRRHVSMETFGEATKLLCRDGFIRQVEMICAILQTKVI